MEAYRAKLFYWPVPGEVSNDTCPNAPYSASAAFQNAANTSAKPITIVTTLSDKAYTDFTTTVTLTSPTIYLSMQDLVSSR